jgi:hypothetical protein
MCIFTAYVNTYILSGYVRSPQQREYKMQRCLTRIISIENDRKQGKAGSKIYHGENGVTEPIAIVRPRVRQLTSQVSNESPKRPNVLLLPFSANREIAKVSRI